MRRRRGHRTLLEVWPQVLAAVEDAWLLVPPRDPAALAGALVRLLTDHPLADMLAAAVTTWSTSASASS